MRYETHLAFSAAISQVVAIFVGEPVSLLLTSMLGSILPDIDHPNSFIGRRVPLVPTMIRNKFGHRTVTHSLQGLFGVTVITLVVLLVLQTSLKLSISFLHLVLGIVLGYGSHILADAFNPTGICLLYPKPNRYSLGKIRLNSPQETYFCLVSLCFTALLVRVNFC